ncbi:hypothetical protein BHE74_00025844 [Ensete ventricosum]|nr:hypothetical protein BHE74_00025844 [Ensete ventricosum]
MPEMCESEKPNLYKEKFVMVKTQCQMCPRYVSPENPTHVKRNLSRRRHMIKCAQDV